MASTEKVTNALQTATNSNPTWLLMKSVYNEMGSDFKNRVPEPTATNVEEFGSAIIEDKATLNEFAQSFTEKFAMSFFNTTFINNKLKKFKKGKMPVGFKIEESLVRVAKGTKYDPENTPKNQMKRTLPLTETIIHVENSRLHYKATISQAQIKTAFTSWSGVQSLFVQIIQSMYDGYELDEFTLMKQLIITYAKRGFAKIVKVAPIKDKESADDFVITAKTYSNLLEFPSDEYNALDIIRQTPKDEQHLMLRAREDARISVKSLAQAFNLGETEFYGHKDMIDNFGEINNAVACLFSQNWYQVYDTDEEMASAYYGDGRYWNYDYHRWGVFSVSRFEPFIMFVTDYSNPVTSVTVTPTLNVMKREEEKVFEAFVNLVDDTTLPEGTEPTLPPETEGGEPVKLSKKVTWSIIGNTDTSGTKIVVDDDNPNKVTVTIGKDEMAEKVRVKAVSDDNKDAYGEAIIQIGDFFGN